VEDRRGKGDLLCDDLDGESALGESGVLEVLGLEIFGGG
jgi:hypothetical protein